jgi:hypothetical protein
MEYLNLDITIGHGAQGSYPVHADSPQGQVPSAGQPEPQVRLDPQAEPLAGLLAGVARGRADSAGLQALGQHLAEALFNRPLLSMFRRLQGAAGQPGQGVRLRLRIGPPELAALPWELLWLPGEAAPLSVSTGSAITRYPGIEAPVRALAAPQPVRMLGLLPASAGIDLARHKAALENAARQAGDIELDWLEGTVTRDHVRTALGQSDYHVVHFIGHGSFESGQPSLQLTDDYGDPFPVSAGAFAGFFRNRQAVRLVVLNACQGAAVDSADALRGVAPQVAAQGVPAVVAMQWDIYDWAAQAFAAGFYGALCAGEDAGEVDTAITRARAMLFDDSPDSRAFATPVLLLRAEGGRLWQSHAASPGRQADPADSGGIHLGDQATVSGDAFTGSKRVVNTGGGAYFGGPLSVQGDFVGGNKTVTQTVGGDIVGGDKITTNYGAAPTQLADLFAGLKRSAEARPPDPEVDKDEIREALRRIEDEASRGESASAARLERWLTALGGMAADLFQAAAGGLASPAMKAPPVIQEVARKALQEAARRRGA